MAILIEIVNLLQGNTPVVLLMAVCALYIKKMSNTLDKIEKDVRVKANSDLLIQQRTDFRLAAIEKRQEIFEAT